MRDWPVVWGLACPNSVHGGGRAETHNGDGRCSAWHGRSAQVAPPAADTDRASGRANAARAAQVHARTLRRIPSALDADDKQVGGAGGARESYTESERSPSGARSLQRTRPTKYKKLERRVRNQLVIDWDAAVRATAAAGNSSVRTPSAGIRSLYSN
jgi:hypothetical protein